MWRPRVVADSGASLDLQSQLVRTAYQAPLLLAVSTSAPPASCQLLAQAGCEILRCPGATHDQRLAYLLDQLGRRRMTNVLVEGGSRLLGSLWDAGQIDEVHVFIAPKLVGGLAALSPLGGTGLAQVPDHPTLADVVIQQLDCDIHVHGRVVSR